MAEPTETPYWERWWFAPLLSCLLCTFAWSVPWYTLDGPQHKHIAVLLQRILAGGPEAHVYAAHVGPWSTNVLFSAAYQLVAAWLTPDQYEKCFVAAVLVATLWSLRAFVRTWAPDNRAWWMVGLPLLCSSQIVGGLYNFAASVPLSLLTLCLLQRYATTGAWSWALGSLLLFWAGLYTHPFTVIAVGSGMLYLLVREWQSPRRTGLLLLSLALLALAFPGFVRPILWPDNLVPFSRIRFHGLAQSIGNLVVAQSADYHRWSLLLGGSIVLLWSGLAWRAWRGRHPLRWWAVGLFLIYLVLPRTHDMADVINDRILPLFWIVVLAAQPALRGRRLALLAGAAVAVQAGQMAMMAQAMRRIAPDVAHATHVMAVVPDGARLYPLDFDGRHGHALFHAVIRHIWADALPPDRMVYAASSFAFPTNAPLLTVTRRIPSSPTYFPAIDDGYPERVMGGELCRLAFVFESVDCAAATAAGLDRLTAQARYYDYLFLHRPPDALLRRLSGLGFTLERESGGFAVWKNGQALSFVPPL